MIGARNGPPLAIGYGDGEMYLGSDAIALGAVHRHHQLSRGRRLGGADPRGRRDLRQAQRGRASRVRSSTAPRLRWSTRPITATSWPRKSTSSRKWSATRWRATSTWRPSASRCRSSCRSTSRTSSASRSSPAAPRATPATSPNTGSSGSARLPVELDVASEFRYREAPLRKGDLAIFISQSGETADTLAALRYAKARGRAHAVGGQRADLDDRARKRDRAADAGRPRNRRRLDQGLHLPADGAGRARGRRRQGARRIVGRRRSQARPRPGRNSAADGGGADDRAADREAGARHRQVTRTCSISAAAPAIRWRWKAR